MLSMLSSSAAQLCCSAAQPLNCSVIVVIRGSDTGTPPPSRRFHQIRSDQVGSDRTASVTGAGHSTTSEKSSPYLHQGMILAHMVPDLARWQNSLRGKLLFGASERPLNHPGADLDDPIVPELEDGAH